MKTQLLALTFALLTGLSGAATAESAGAVDAETQLKITEMLTAQGYEVRAIQMEDGKIEVYALKDGSQFELYLDENLAIIDSKSGE